MDIAPPADPIAAVTHPDPYPYYAELARAVRPEWNVGLGMWVVSNPAHVASILQHPGAHVVAPSDAPAGFAEYARFNEGERHARLRAEVVERIAGVALDDPPIATGDLDAFIERFALYALARDQRANVKGDLLFQAYDATRALIGNAWAARAAEPALGAAEAVAKALRDDPPVHNTRRRLVADIEIAGTTLQGGDAVLVVLVRTTFGMGAHACPGDELAQRIAVMALTRLLADGVTPSFPTGYVPRPNVRISLFAPLPG
ncbi:MAG: hypothetical protein M3R30_00825 [Candidatus Eremiobacteraeota bacterium]|nr:hypothetical protein [Candidatus Eremiobacteraeota bacterium]